MNMITQLSDFIGFFVISILLGIVFDFFRAYRKIKRISFISLIIQDIIYFLISIAIISYAIINVLDSSMRGYIFISIIFGILFYIYVLSKYVIDIYLKFFKVSKDIIQFLILPLNVIMYICIKIYIFFKKFIKKCCKKFNFVLTLFCKLKSKMSFKKLSINKKDLKLEKWG